MHNILGVLLLCLGLACSRDTSKAFRSMPAISNSLVNLGKMDISFHFNSKSPDRQQDNLRPDSYTHSASPFFVPRSEPLVDQTVESESCPCSTIKNFRNPFVSSNSPADMLSQILKSNDLFSYNQEPMISTTCCDSHEHAQEDTVYFDFSPRVPAESPMQPALSPFPLMLDAILPKLQTPSATNSKAKAIEIFFFPKSKDGFLDLTKMSSLKDKKSKKAEIQVVGDKKLKNEFKSFKYRPTFSLYPNKRPELMEKQRDRMEKKVIKADEKTEERQDDKQEERQETMNPRGTEKTTPGPFTASVPLL